MIAFFLANILEYVRIYHALVNAPGVGGNHHGIDAVPEYLAQVYSNVVLDALMLVILILLGMKRFLSHWMFG